MKKYSIIAAVAALSLTAVSCGDKFLTVDNPTAEFINEYFTTEEHLTEALYAAYDPLEWPDYNSEYNPLCIMSDIMADQIWVGGEHAGDNLFWKLMSRFEATADNTMKGIWSSGYSGVKRCNDALTYIKWVEGLDPEIATNYEAQLRVLRVYYYSWLWKFWGNIPYYEENLQQPFICKQYTADEVYDKMIVDLEGAIALDALPMRQEAENSGLMSKAIAYMLYAELAMYQKDETRLPTALAYMKEIIADPAYDLVSDYGTIFTEEGEWSQESIFEINYKSDGSYRGWNGGEPMIAGGTVLPRLIGPRGFTATDGSDYKDGWGFAPIRLSLLQTFSPDDARLDATVWNADAAGTYTKAYQDTGYFLNKYQPRTRNQYNVAGDGQLNYCNNLRIYRYSETLLNAAELVLRGYGDGDAAKWLNDVHTRSLPGDRVDLSLENVKKERALEFVGEGKRYWDLVRWEGDTDGITASEILVADPEGTQGGRTRGWTASKKYIPIAQSEIDATADSEFPLQQNTAYLAN